MARSFDKESTVQTLILTLHVVACLALIVLVLLQSGKEGMGVIFGGGNTSLFGSTGAGGMLAKLTAFLAVLFIITSLSYNVLTSSRKTDDSAILDVKLEDVQPAPTAPAAPAPAAPLTEQKSN